MTPKSEARPVTLSFDNGPDPEVTPAVLDVLARRGARATFFVVGERLAQARAVAERAVAEGHWIGNHTWSHSLTFRERGDPRFVRAEIDRCQAEIGALSRPEPLFRPFGGGGHLPGALNGVAAEHLARRGYTCVTWNAVPRDWADQDGWPATALRQVAASAWPLVVLHDVHPRAMRRLDGFLGALLDAGCAFRQEFPDDCVPIRRGVATAAMAGVLAA